MKMDRNPVIKASEIAQYEYCPVAWFLRRQGYKPDSKHLDPGSKAHADLGEKITSIQKSEEVSRKVSYVGYALMILAMIMLALRWLL